MLYLVKYGYDPEPNFEFRNEKPTDCQLCIKLSDKNLSADFNIDCQYAEYGYSDAEYANGDYYCAVVNVYDNQTDEEYRLYRNGIHSSTGKNIPEQVKLLYQCIIKNFMYEGEFFENLMPYQKAKRYNF